MEHKITNCPFGEFVCPNCHRSSHRGEHCPLVCLLSLLSLSLKCLLYSPSTLSPDCLLSPLSPPSLSLSLSLSNFSSACCPHCLLNVPFVRLLTVSALSPVSVVSLPAVSSTRCLNNTLSPLHWLLPDCLLPRVSVSVFSLYCLSAVCLLCPLYAPSLRYLSLDCLLSSLPVSCLSPFCAVCLLHVTLGVSLLVSSLCAFPLRLRHLLCLPLSPFSGCFLDLVCLFLFSCCLLVLL